MTGSTRSKRRDLQAEGQTAEAYFRALANHDQPWATSSQLGFDKATATKLETQLRNEGRIVSVGTVGGRVNYSLLAGESVTERLVNLAERVLIERSFDKVVLISLTAENSQHKSFPTKIRQHIKLAAKKLELTGQAFPVKVGNARFVVLAANLRSLLAKSESNAMLMAPMSVAKEGALDSAVVRRAYNKLVREKKSPNIIIADLRKEADVDLGALHEWVLEERRARRAVALLGEPARATQEQLAAAVQVEGRPHLYVQLMNTERE